MSLLHLSSFFLLLYRPINYVLFSGFQDAPNHEDLSAVSVSKANELSVLESTREEATNLDRLVDLSTLGSENPVVRHRYRREDFESAGGSSADSRRLRASDNDPFCELDPFSALCERTNSPVS